MDANELGRWTRFAAKGGIGKCSALQDCIAERPEDLMFMKDDEITVLMQIPGQADLYLGYCEGVVGNFRGESVTFHGRLKKPVLTKRQSAASPIPRPSSSQGVLPPARDAPSPAVSTLTNAPSPVVQPLRNVLSSSQEPISQSSSPKSSPAIAITHEPEDSSPVIAPSISSSSSIFAAPFSPVVSPAVSPHPERSMSHESQNTSVSSMPRTPADDGNDEATVASDHENSDTASLVPPIRLDNLAKQLSNDGPIQYPYSPASTTAGFPPADRDSSMYSDADSTRPISMASSDNGVGNIGLSLLQDFVSGDVGDSDSDSDGDVPAIKHVQSPESTLENVRPSSIRSASQYSESPRSATLALPLEPPLTSRSERSELSLSQYSESPLSATQALPSNDPPLSARSESEYDYDSGGEDWAGADDIYDQYRYSRYSMASRMSRFSKGSMRTIASGSDAPPMPAGRPSLDSIAGRERKGSKGKIPPSKLTETTTSDDVQRSSSEALDEPPGSSRMQKSRPAPLTFKQEPGPSPLLHATFGSPQASPTVPSATSGTFGSPTLMSPVYPTNIAAATNVRNRVEHEHGRSDGSDGNEPTSHRSHPQQLGGGDVDQHMPMTAVSQAAEFVEEHHPAARDSPPPTPALPQTESRPVESSAVLEKRMLANAEPPADQLPPPPYSPAATPGPSSSTQHASPPLTTSPPPQSMIVPPGAPPQARPRDPNRPPPHPMMRQSLFMPHPGAPKPDAASLGPMYGRQDALHPLPPPHVGPPPGSAYHILGMAFAARREGRPAPPTIYGRFEFDLSMSMGPVPITFSTEPQNNIPANRVRPPMPMPWTPSRTGSPASQLSADLAGRRSADPSGRRSATSPPISAQGTPAQNQISKVLGGAAAGPSQPIPRQNFTPTLHNARPRSRSFSGVTGGDLSVRTQVLNSGSRDDATIASPEELKPPSSPIRPLQITTKRSKTAMATAATTTVQAAANVPAPQRATVSHSPTVLRGLHAPSPLSLSQNNTVAVAAPPVRSPPPRASTNPLPASSPPPADTFAPGHQVARALSLDQAAPTSGTETETGTGLGLGLGLRGGMAIVSPGLNTNGIGWGSPAPQTQSPLATLSENLALSSSPPSSPRSAVNFPNPPSPKVLRHSRSAIVSTTSLRGSERTSFSSRSRTASQTTQTESRPSVDTVMSDSGPPVRVVSPAEGSTEGGTLGLRIGKRSNGRLQMAPLRLITSNQSAQSITSPTVSVTKSELAGDGDTVQVQDTDFELVKPTLPVSPFAGSFESLPSPTRPGLLRTGSPASALSDLSTASSFRVPGDVSPSDTKSPKERETPASQAEAHRQREQRWISAMSSIPASQARKSKKIRKLVLEGVPASVRYQVWATLTDSKGKRMEGLYQRLAQRGQVAVFSEIERDIQQSFMDHPQLQDGSLAKLLHAYLCMVPDVQYTRGLAMVAAQLLLQSPEEDAFWTFISLMDSHLRPYFSNTSVQLEVDASLFGRAVEANDPATAKKVFGDMGIAPITVCRAWFQTVFADALPSEYLVRLWDVFLFEGVPFLFRAGLAMFSCNRRTLLQSTSQESLLDTLYHPPPTSLPSTPDAFVELAFSMKLKDDDLRKQRNKLEAQIKRHTAQSRPSPISPATPQTISLPKNGI